MLNEYLIYWIHGEYETDIYSQGYAANIVTGKQIGRAHV